MDDHLQMTMYYGIDVYRNSSWAETIHILYDGDAGKQKVGNDEHAKTPLV